MKRNRKGVTITVSRWLYNWLEAQKRGGIVISRMIERAIIEQYGLSPPDIKAIEKKIREAKGHEQT